MAILPQKGAWARWDWPTRLGVVTTMAGLGFGAASWTASLFDVDLPGRIGAGARAAVAWVAPPPDPWALADQARADAQTPAYRQVAGEVLDRLNEADLGGALEYHRGVAEARCYDDPHYMALMRVRFALAKFLHTNDFYDRNTDLSDALNLDRATKLWALFRHMRSGAASIAVREDLDLKLFAATLLEYHDKIVATDGWREKFAALDPDHLNVGWQAEERYAPYLDAGFPPHADFCMNDYSFAFSLDTYLYGFWWRRWREGLMPAARLALEAFMQVRVFPEPTPPEGAAPEPAASERAAPGPAATRDAGHARAPVSADTASGADDGATPDRTLDDDDPESWRATADEALRRLNAADLSDGVAYHLDYGDRPECAENDRYVALLRVRVALGRFLYWRPDNMSATRVYNDNLDLRDFFVVNRPAKLAAALASIASGEASAALRSDLDVGLFARTLLDYHDRVVATPGWREKFAALPEDHLTVKALKVRPAPYVAAGFPPPDDPCMTNAALYLSLDDYFYSFWLRRWREGLMEPTRQALSLVDDLLLVAVAPSD